MEYIQRNPEKSFVYATPFLAEIERVMERCSRFKQPRNYTGKRGEEHACQKIEDFNNLLLNGEDVAVTHYTFLKSTEETIDGIKGGQYVLILDEVLDIIVDFNRVAGNGQTVSKSDIKYICNKGSIRIGDNLKVEWIDEDEYPESHYATVAEMAKKGILYCVDGKLFLSVFPPEIFTAFSEIYILTYMFEGSIFQSYFKMFGIDYCMKSVSNETGRYEICAHDTNEDLAWRQAISQYIEIYKPDAKYTFRGKALSKSWFDKRDDNKDEFQRLKRGLRAFFNGQRSRYIMWTCPKESSKALKFAGINESRTSKEKEHIREEKAHSISGRADDEPKSYECFVPCNAKATNDFNDRKWLAYCCNMYMNPEFNKFFNSYGVTVSNDVFALSCLVQWIWRSAIRNPTPENITVYIPSNRMRELFTKWLYPQE